MRSANLFFFTQPQETFEDWHQAQQNTPFEEKQEQFFVEFQQIPINYGTITDTAYQDSLYWKEQHLYGSSRLGIAKPELEVTNYKNSNFSMLTSNFKNYELTNHLGNVLATIKDEKQQIDQNADGIVDYYEPIVITANDYYPFGMVMPNRSFSLAGSNYRFGFNGKEDDRETGTQDYGFRIYNPQIGKFLSVDPLFKSYPWYTPYQFAGNKPIIAKDLDGLEELIVIRWFDQGEYQGQTAFRIDNKRQRVHKRGGDMQLIEMDISNRRNVDNVVRSKDLTIGGVLNLVKNDDGTFKGLYKLRGTLSQGEQKTLNSLSETDSRENANGSQSTRWKNVVKHPYDSEEIDVISTANINQVKEFLNQDTDAKLDIVSSSSVENSTGKPEYNLDKSQERANNILNVLIESGVPADRINSVQGIGATNQYDIPGNSRENNLKENRRTEIRSTYCPKQ